MNIDALFQHHKRSDLRYTKSTVIVVDVLRATTTIITAIKNGAKQIIPTVDPGNAVDMASRLGGDCLLCGERGGVKIQGFDLGNSPQEFTSEAVENKTIIMSTTNGTNAITAMSAATSLLIGALINRTAVARAAVEKGDPVILCCAGTEGRFSADDAIAAGGIIDAMLSMGDCALSDFALCMHKLYLDYRDGRIDLMDTFHYRRLYDLGFTKDLEYCLQEDSTEIVPRFHDGVITL